MKDYKTFTFIIIWLIQILNISVNEAMVNGEAVSGSDYKWMVSLRKIYPDWKFVIDGEHKDETFYKRFCGGSLINLNPITIVTAAHCLDSFNCCQTDDNSMQDKLTSHTLKYEASNINAVHDGGWFMRDIVDGSHQYTNTKLFADFGRTKGLYYGNEYDESDDDYKTVEITSCNMIHVHPNYAKSTVKDGFDIAVITIPNENYKLLPKDYPIAQIPPMYDSNTECCGEKDELQAIGYGLDDDIEEKLEKYKTETLEKISLEYYSSDPCVKLMNSYYEPDIWHKIAGFFEKRWYDDGINRKKICVKGDNQDACMGDSGGPLFKNGEKTTIYGVAAHVVGGMEPGDSCNTEFGDGTPSFYTSVGHYHDWIFELIETPNQPVKCLVETDEETEDKNTDNSNKDEALSNVVKGAVILGVILIIFKIFS